MSTDPTHSMLAKDHFSNVLNEPAGKVASQVVRWVVPQLMACWDDDRIDVNRTLTRIVNGVFHHPALRNVGNDGAVDCRRQMFGIVQQWWGSKPEPQRQILRGQLSREGVEQGKNHLAGVQDTGMYKFPFYSGGYSRHKAGSRRLNILSLDFRSIC